MRTGQFWPGAMDSIMAITMSGADFIGRILLMKININTPMIGTAHEGIYSHGARQMIWFEEPVYLSPVYQCTPANNMIQDTVINSNVEHTSRQRCAERQKFRIVVHPYRPGP
jgi:hypothetical protein